MMGTPPKEKWLRAGDLWECPACGKQYPKRGQGHSCGDVPLDEHFRTRPRARELFDAFINAIERECGAVRLSSAKTRIGIMNHLTFAAVIPRKDFLRGHILLQRRVESPRFTRVDNGPPYWVHVFELRDQSEIDETFLALLRESYLIGTDSN